MQSAVSFDRRHTAVSKSTSRLGVNVEPCEGEKKSKTVDVITQMSGQNIHQCGHYVDHGRRTSECPQTGFPQTNNTDWLSAQ